MKVFCGIDVGKSGAIAIIDHSGKVTFISTMPKIGDQTDVRGLHRILGLLKSETYIGAGNDHQDEVHVVFENLHSIFGSGAKANFEFGKSNGFVEMAVVSYGYKYLKCNPKEWQKLCWQGITPKLYWTKDKNDKPKEKIDTKATSSLACNRLYPNVDVKITEKGNKSKNDHDGIVDAVLLAHYCYLKFK